MLAGDPVPGSGVGVSLADTLWLRDKARRHAKRDSTGVPHGSRDFFLKAFISPSQRPLPLVVLTGRAVGGR